MDKSYCPWKYLHQLPFNMVSCEVFQDILATDGCVRTFFAQQILMSLEQQEVTDTNFEKCHWL